MEDPGSDYHNFSPSSAAAHRLPTLNGEEALLDAIEKHRPISTNLATLDSILRDPDSTISSDGGISRGAVTEIYGPPGSGKTHFAIQLAANVLGREGHARVIWIDTSSELPYSRLEKFLSLPAPDLASGGEATPRSSENVEDERQSADSKLDYLYISSFTHLLSLLLQPTPDLISRDAILLVVDDFSRVITNALPHDERTSLAFPRDTRPSLSRDGIISKSIANRRASMLNAISVGLSRLAATLNLAVVILTKVSSNRKLGVKNASMKSALSSPQWNEHISTRIVLYRIFWPNVGSSKLDKQERRKQRKRESHALRVAEVERTCGKDVHVEGVRFVILSNRLHAVDPPKTIEATALALPGPPPLETEDNEEAMGNLGLEDAREDEDQSIWMPEDVLPSSSHASGLTMKRKIAEIADSEDESELGTEEHGRVPRTLAFSRGFIPSSQIPQNDRKGDSDRKEDSPPRAAGGSQPNVLDADDKDDEMLLQD